MDGVTDKRHLALCPRRDGRPVEERPLLDLGGLAEAAFSGRLVRALER